MIEVWRHHRVVGNVVVAGLIGLFLVLILANMARVSGLVAAIRETQQSNTVLTQETHRTAELVQSCVTPGGACYERGQRQTGAVVGKLNEYVLLSASCTAHIATATHGLRGISQVSLTNLITACIRSQLAVQRGASR